MKNIKEWFQQSIGYTPEITNKLLISLFAILVLWFIRLLVLKLALSRIENITVRYQWRKSVTYAIGVLGILLVGRIWFEAFHSISTFLGLVSAGLAVALKEPVVNLAGWGFILFKSPFEIGDRIQVGEQSGDVIDMEVLQFSILEIGNWVDADQSTGRIIHIPNGIVFNQPIANYSRGLRFLWNEIPVLVTFESDWEKGKEILSEIAFKHSKDVPKSAERGLKKEQQKYPIQYSKLEPIVYTSVKDSGVLLTIRYLCEPLSRRTSEHSIWEEVLRRFAENETIHFAYPTQRFYTENTD
ncbi:MAG: mechanosensitive ion channel family protein [Proteobacteria bacterium]|nr:mechanosensitive ion channel family protein [Pseudomonadota bacterium]